MLFGRKRLISGIPLSKAPSRDVGAGARPGSLLFRGQVDNGQYAGTAYNPHFGAVSFQVKGPVLDNGERIMLTGQAPHVGRNCRTYGSYTNNLEFRRLKPPEPAQSQENHSSRRRRRRASDSQNLRRRRG